MRTAKSVRVSQGGKNFREAISAAISYGTRVSEAQKLVRSMLQSDAKPDELLVSCTYSSSVLRTVHMLQSDHFSRIASTCSGQKNTCVLAW